MNDEKITIIPFQLKEEKEEKKEENDEEYEVIKESYHSSPRYGTKSKIVKKVNNNITFSPVETSTKPYFKYCVVQIKEEQKNDISQTETTQTKLNDEKSKINNLTNCSNNNELRNSLREFKEEKYEGNRCLCIEEENKEEKESEYNYVRIIEKKSSEITLNISYKCNEENKKNEKEKKSKSKNILVSETSTPKTYHHSLRNKEDSKLKMKLHLNNNEDEEKKQKLKHSQRNIYNILNNIVMPEGIHSDKFNNNKFLNKMKIEENKDMVKVKSIFNLNSLSLKKEKDKKVSPRNKDKNNPIKVTSSFTTNNIKRLKKPKKKEEKEKENDYKKTKLRVLRQHSYIPVGKEKKYKIAHNEDKDNNNNKRRRRHSLIPNVDMKKQDKNIFNIFINNGKEEKEKDREKEKEKQKLKKIRSRHQKMKSLGEGNNNNFFEALKNEKCRKSEKDKDKDKDNSYLLKRKQNNYNNNKNKIEDTFKDVENNNNKNHEFPKTSKSKRKVSIFENNENKRKKRMHTEEKKDGMKKKSTFSGIKDKEKKEKKIKSKKGKKSKKSKKENVNHQTHSIKRVVRKDKSFTLGSKTKLINEDNMNNKNQNDNSFNSSKSNINNIEIRRTPSRTSKNLNINKPNENSQTDIRRNSTRDLFRDNNRKEKITALTNYQNIENINDYTKQCLQIIPCLYELGDKMSRCKQKIHPNLVGNKKVALFDLDETIVHCIGEINMNNVESFSMQCDAKIKVQLPGGRKVATIGINIRPHWEEALKKIKDKYHIIAFTASHDSYADSVLNFLDPKNKYFEYRLYRKNCVLCDINEMKFYVKDLKIFEDAYDLKDVVIIDNSVLSFAYHLDNGIPISPFYDSKTDTELLDIADFLVKYADENDIRDKLKEVYKLNQYLEILKDYTSEESEESSDNLGEEENNKGENTENNCSITKNLTNINLNKPVLVNNINININTNNNKMDKENEKKFDSTSNKNISQINLKLKEITKIFNDNDKDNESENEGKEAKSDKKLHTPKINCIQKGTKAIHKSVFSPEKNYPRNKKRCKQRTLLYGINFKKEWEKKQKELKNK